jgi:ABC-type multidrug transport system fused ATPase/permease subunit
MEIMEKTKIHLRIIRFLKNWRGKSGSLLWLARSAKPYLPGIIMLFLLNVAISLLGVVMVVISKEIIDLATARSMLAGRIVIYITMVLASLLISSFSNYSSVIINEKLSFHIRKQFYERIIRSQWMEITKYHTGDLLLRLTGDINNISDGMISTIPTVFRLMIELIVTFFTLFYYQPFLAVFALVMAPVAALVCFFLGRKLKNFQKKVQEAEAEYNSFIQESFSNLLVVKSFTNEEYVLNRLTRLRDKCFYWIYKRSRMNIASTAVMSLAFNLGYLCAFVYGAVKLADNTITFGTLTVFITLVNRIQAPVLSLAHSVPAIVSIFASSERIVEIQKIDQEEKPQQHIAAQKVGININEMTFGYNDETLLDNISVSIRPGEIIAIIGRSGIGKTTLIRLILSFVKSIKGSIEFFNESGEKESASAGAREFIAYVPQGNTLFSGTIRENIMMGRTDAAEEEVIDALKMSQAYDFVRDLPNGLDTVIGERGYGISEGQAQRIAIARALIRKAPVIIFDEATSSLDELTELAVLKAIRKLEYSPTCIMITHRRSVLNYCDREFCINEKGILTA